VNHAADPIETALRRLQDDPGPAAPAGLADRALTRARHRGRVRGMQAAVAVVMIAVLGTFALTDVRGRSGDADHPAPPAAGPTPSALKARENVLVLGTDSTGHDGRIGVRPDTVMVVSVDTRTGATTLLSLPRNLQRVPFPPGSPGAKAWPKGFDCDSDCLLNSIWSWAETDDRHAYAGYRSPGLAATTQAVEQITGLPVDETVVLNLGGLSELVDAVGGVDVTVRERLPIGGTPQVRRAQGWIEAGRRHLDGREALWYARSRWSTSDLDRIGRQQCLVGALLDQVDARAFVTGLPRIARALSRNVSTSLDPDELSAWADLATRARAGEIRRVVLGSGDPTRPDYAGLRKQVRAAIGASPASGGSGPADGGRKRLSPAAC
jgi:polyisoprenyl-teichoic acid--peptidoglycan teichoic acid transferase